MLFLISAWILKVSNLPFLVPTEEAGDVPLRIIFHLNMDSLHKGPLSFNRAGS